MKAKPNQAIKEKWCGREDSNLHGLLHSDLNAARLPVPPRPHVLFEADAPYKATPLFCEAPNVSYMKAVMQKFPAIEWAVSTGPVPYQAATGFMEARARAIRDDGAPELVWFVEHPPLYTSGTSAKQADLRDPERFPVFAAGRGGEYTYHGPGQRVAYVMLDVARRGRDVRAFVRNLERWIITALESFNLDAGPREGRVGVWIDRTQAGGPLREDKIAAIGVRLKKWVSFHGISLNVEPDLEHFTGITPCGIADPRYGVTSLVDLGIPATMDDVDIALRDAFETVFDCQLVAVPAPLEPATD